MEITTMGPVQTLHDFALNLTQDPQALADFNADPQGMLAEAGLGDLSAADVQEILPMVTDAAPAMSGLPGSVAGGDVAGTLDTAVTGATAAAPAGDVTQVAAGVLGSLPDLSGVFGGVSDVADATGLNTVTDGVLHTGADVVDGVAGTLSGVPVAGPLLDAAATDVQNTASAVGDHVFDGKLVGAAVDGVTNHLGDAMLADAAVDTVSDLPGIGGPLGGLLNDVRYEGGALLGTANGAIGSTPVGVPSGQELAAKYGLADFDATGDVHDTLDHVASAAPVAAAVPEVPATPSVDEVVGSAPETVNDLAANAPVGPEAINDLPSSVGDLGVTDVQPDLAGAAPQLDTVTNVVDEHVDDLGVGSLAAAAPADLPEVANLPTSTDDLPVGL